MRWVLFVVVSAVLAGCGGSSDKPSAKPVTPKPVGPKRISHQQFVARLDHPCTAANRRYRKFDSTYVKAQNAGDYDGAAVAVERATRLGAPWAGKIDMLVPPPADADAFLRFETLSKRIDGLTDRLPAALCAKNLEEFNRLYKLIDRAAIAERTSRRTSA